MLGNLLGTLMENQEMRKAFGLRVKALRKQRKWTQKELATKVGVRTPQLNKYEAGLHVPPADKLVRLAELFDSTVDYLLTGNSSGEKPLHNVRLMERFQALQEFAADDLEAVIKLIDAMVIKHQVEGVLRIGRGGRAAAVGRAS